MSDQGKKKNIPSIKFIHLQTPIMRFSNKCWFWVVLDSLWDMLVPILNYLTSIIRLILNPLSNSNFFCLFSIFLTLSLKQSLKMLWTIIKHYLNPDLRTWRERWPALKCVPFLFRGNLILSSSSLGDYRYKFLSRESRYKSR